MYYPCSENKDADQLRSCCEDDKCAFVFAYASCLFSHDMALNIHGRNHMPLSWQEISGCYYYLWQMHNRVEIYFIYAWAWSVSFNQLSASFCICIVYISTHTVHKRLCSLTYEPPHGKANNLHRRKQRRRSASR